MPIDDFERYPLTFGPSPVHPLKRLSAHLGGARWGQARGRQSACGLRRQQDQEARVPRPRCPRAGRRHPGVDRRHPVQPHPPGGRSGSPPRPEVLPRPGEMGRLGRPGQRQGRQHPPVADHGRRRQARPVRVRHRHPHLVGGGDPRGRGGQAGGIPAGASEHRLGGLGFANWAYEVAEQERDLVSSSTPSWCAP